MNKSTLTTIVVILVLVIGGGYYFWSIGNNTPSGTGASLLSQSSASGSNVGADELALLNQVSSIKINSKFFTSKMFLSLMDTVQVIPSVSMYRSDPFSPVAGVPSPYAPAGMVTGRTPVSPGSASRTVGQ